MPGFNGVGVFVRTYNWTNDANAGIKILAARMDTEDNGFATGLSTCITKDGQTTVTANLPMATFKHTGVGNASARTDYLAAGQFQDAGFAWGGTGGGTADVITISLTPAIAAYAAGQTFRFISSGANTTNVTLNINGIGAKAVTKGGTNALVAGDIPSGAVVAVIYDGTQFQLLNVSIPSVSGLQTGNIIMHGASSAPSGFLLCDGSAVSRTTYAALFAVVSTTFGAGDASTTFNVPDMRSRSPVGTGTGSGLSARAMGATGGEETHVLSLGELAQHNHTATDSGHSHTEVYPTSGSGTGFQTTGSSFTGGGGASAITTASATANITVGNAGSNTAHNTMHPFLVVNFIIKT